MASIVRFPDPMLECIRYLSRYYPLVVPEVPEGWAWDGLLIVVTDVGGGGAYEVVLDDARLMIEIAHPDHAVASEAARTVYGLLRQWPAEQSGVYWRDTIMRPTWSPDEQTRTPGYAMTVALAFRGEAVKINQR